MKFKSLNKYKCQGEFIFRKGNKLSKYCKQVPHSPGVYLFKIIKEGKETLAYIGASGTMHQDGNFGNQLMNNRLKNLQSKKIKRQAFFETEIKVKKLDGIRVSWFVTFDEEHQDLPKSVEGKLIQKYFDKFEKLPIWNNEF
ncbi:MAG: hypothetical protein DWQ39_09050 [Bacteroidetes bacterium]|nr:MAG: hypothetical protein DWQ33_02280 [Bacteroidota bacterium]REK03790.1 MAG: hypothetical protein DWQ39_09050 [Bacteroidota bacterium]REK48737.1 MAG: hypothetical protein DWQ48_09420 [Bacteroidota bacterium]